MNQLDGRTKRPTTRSRPSQNLRGTTIAELPKIDGSVFTSKPRIVIAPPNVHVMETNLRTQAPLRVNPVRRNCRACQRRLIPDDLGRSNTEGKRVDRSLGGMREPREGSGKVTVRAPKGSWTTRLAIEVQRRWIVGVGRRENTLTEY